jgi:hypothetical protein
MHYPVDGLFVHDKDQTQLAKLGFRCVGEFSKKNGRIQFSLSASKNETGSYVFVVDQQVKYVGVTKNTLYARMNGYRNPGPTQETNKRINPKIGRAGRVQIYFLSESEIKRFATIIRRDQIEEQISTDLSTFERFLISMFKPEWNRG